MLPRLMRLLNMLWFIFLVASILCASNPRITGQLDEVRHFTRPLEFDYFTWTLDAIAVKLEQAAMGTPFYFNTGARHQIVVDYLHSIDTILQDENKLNLIYADPSIADPLSASAGLRVKLDNLYTRRDQLAPLAEAVLQEQVGAVLANLGLTTGGQPIPPVLFHVSPMPCDLIISPRDKIQQDESVLLDPTLGVDRQAALEDQVDAALDVSSLVVPVGGLGSYPTMVMPLTAIDQLADTISHEWIHNWLSLRPLGLNYGASPELRTMNETTASIAGHEITNLVLRRYYPELIPAPPPTDQAIVLSWAPPLPVDTPPPFDFNAEMHATRIHVDELLAQGKIDEAEAYMKQRRQVFWDNGWSIRKLNQAFFAFYGAYADVPGGAAGADPVGPAVRLLRAGSGTLTDFLNHISRFTSFGELQAAISP